MSRSVNDAPVAEPSLDEQIRGLKADAYDCLAQIEQWQLKLQQVNQRIRELDAQLKQADVRQ